MKKIIFFMLFPAVLFLSASCANIVAPSGGPKDTLAPVIVMKEPADNTVNFNGRLVSLEFSKYMNRQSVIDNMTITPDVRKEYSWSGRKLEIEFPEGLAPNTTYSLVLGTEYSDLKNNKPLMSYSLVFSTGPVLDSGMIRGKVIGGKPGGKFIWAYKIDSMDPDTLYIPNNKPHYSVQLGNTGEFAVKALKNGRYRILCVDDKFKDGLLDELTDSYSCAFFDPEVQDSLIPFMLMRDPLPKDKTGPALNSAVALNSRQLTLYFSEPLQKESVAAEKITVRDSTGRIVTVHSAAVTAEKNRILLTTKEKLDAGMKYAISFGPGGVRDTLGMTIQDSMSSAQTFGSDEEDSARPFVSSVSLRDSSRDVPPNITDTGKEGLFFRTSVPVDSLSPGTVELYRDTALVSIGIASYGNTEFAISTGAPLAENTTYRLVIHAEKLRSYRGLKGDSVRTLVFTTGFTPAYSSVSGEVSGSEKCAGRITIEAANMTVAEHRTVTAESGRWSLPNLTAGKYVFFLYCDENGNGAYDTGNILPFRFAERFSMRQNELTVKQRWDYEKVILYFE